MKVKVFPSGPIWKRHLNQLRPRHTSAEDEDPCDDWQDSDVPVPEAGRTIEPASKGASVVDRSL